MSALTTTTAVVRPHRPFLYRRHVRRLLATSSAVHVPADRYIPHSTADLWRSARRPLDR